MSEDTSSFAARNRRSTVRLGAWTFAWLVTMAMVAFGPVFLWDKDPMITGVFIVINLGVGAGMIVANIRHVQDMDELQKQIQLEGMGISLGVGLIVGLSYSMLDITDLITWDAEISHLVLVQGLTYLSAILVGTWRYK